MLRGPAGGVVVSARITIGASSPLAPCTVITRTSSRVISMSRFTSVCAVRSQATKPCSDGVSRALVVEREIEEFAQRVVGLVAEPREELRAAALGVRARAA